MAKKVKDGTRDRPMKKQPFVTECEPQPDRTFEEERGGDGPVWSGGDLDAAREEANSGEKTVGGSVPTPDPDSVNQLGEAVGLPAEEAEEDETRDLLDLMRSHAPGSEQELPEMEEEMEELEELEEEEEELGGEEEEPR